MFLVIDTNTLLQKHVNRFELLEHFLDNSPPKFFLTLDQGGLIEEEYFEEAMRVRNNGDSEAPIVLITEQILKGYASYIVKINSQLSDDSQCKRVININCKSQVEKQLFITAKSAKEGVVVHPNETNNLNIERNYLKDDVLCKIQEDCEGLIVHSLKEVLKLLREQRDPAPNTIPSLESFLKPYKILEKRSEERSFLEFKNPQVPYLTKNLLQNAVKAVCGMLNNIGGLVFIGVDDNGEIKPFPPKFKDKNKSPSHDQLLRVVYAEIDRICPRPGKLVIAWTIPSKNNEECVIAIYVTKGTKEYKYKNKKWIRRGPQTIEG